jgi:predicted nucleic acid-binding protein
MQVLQEFYVTVTRKVGAPLGETEAAKIVRDLSSWTVHEPRAEDLQSAFEVQGRYRVSFWDAMIVQSASQLGCDAIWSEDLNEGQVYNGVRVINPLISSGSTSMTP